MKGSTERFPNCHQIWYNLFPHKKRAAIHLHFGVQTRNGKTTEKVNFPQEQTQEFLSIEQKL